MTEQQQQYFLLYDIYKMCFLGGSDSEESACSEEDQGSIPGFIYQKIF